MVKIPVGVSQCLLGERVRYDGNHKYSALVTEVLGTYLEFRPFCPEVALGLGVPRKPIRLVASGEQTRVLGTEAPFQDLTEALWEKADEAMAQMADICGYIFMQKSPSCGVFRVKRYDARGDFLDQQGQGIYAQRWREQLPYLPVEEAGRLSDPGLRENFLTRVFALQDYKNHLGSNPTAKGLIDFYSRYKYQVMAHHVPSYFAIGRFLSHLGGDDINTRSQAFLMQLMTALSQPATRKGNTNVLMHLRGYLKSVLEVAARRELSHAIESYRRGDTPLIVPLTLLKHHLLKVDKPYLAAQTFWSPCPEALGRRYQLAGDEA